MLDGKRLLLESECHGQGCHLFDRQRTENLLGLIAKPRSLFCAIVETEQRDSAHDQVLQILGLRRLRGAPNLQLHGAWKIKSPDWPLGFDDIAGQPA